MCAIIFILYAHPYRQVLCFCLSVAAGNGCHFILHFLFDVQFSEHTEKKQNFQFDRHIYIYVNNGMRNNKITCKLRG